MKTYVFVGGLTVEQALEKVKKYYPNYNGNQHFYTVSQQPLKGCVCNKGGDIFGHCFEDYFIQRGFTRLDKEENMNKYYKIETYSTFFIVNPEFRGESVYSKEYYDLPQNSKGYSSTNGSWDISKVKSIKEITEEEYNKVKNPTVNVSLNIDYSAVISKDGVKVGCQTFTHESILNLAKELEKFLDKK